MKLTKEDKELFKNLSQSGLAKQLIDYLERLSDNICDARTWGEGDTKESTTKASEYIKEHISKRIVSKDRQAPRELNDYE